MSDPVSIDIASVAVPLTPKERELWLDLFTNFCESVMGATLEEHRGSKQYPEEQLKNDITLSADLADHAIQEVQYRFSQKYASLIKERVASRRPRR